MNGFLLEEGRVTVEYGLDPNLPFVGHTPSTGRFDIMASKRGITVQQNRSSRFVGRDILPIDLALSDFVTLRLTR